MAAGEIEVLVLGPGVNPAFTLPGGLKAADAHRARCRSSVSFANQPDETTALAHLVLPDTHWLESWGDYSPREGVVGLMQPTMKPIRDSRPMGDVLLAVGRTVLGTEEGKGPLPWTTFEQYLKDDVGAGREGRSGRPRSQQGGVWRDVARRGGDGEARRRSRRRAGEARGRRRRLRAARVSRRSACTTAVAPRALVAAGNAGPDDAGGVGRAGSRSPTETATVARHRPGRRGEGRRRRTGSIELPAYLSPSLHPKAVAIPIGHRYAPYHVPRYVAATADADEPDGAAAGGARGRLRRRQLSSACA